MHPLGFTAHTEAFPKVEADVDTAATGVVCARAHARV